jgi:hypothetical protein
VVRVHGRGTGRVQRVATVLPAQRHLNVLLHQLLRMHASRYLGLLL